MTVFQLILLVSAGTVFYLFFKQLFGGNYPKRGIDFEAEVSDERIGGLLDPGKTFAQTARSASRIDTLLDIANRSAEQEDWAEVEKAMQSARILDENNVEVLRRLGVALLHTGQHAEAAKTFETLVGIDPRDDLAESSWANALHQLGDDAGALEHHERAVKMDPAYAPHYYNYANTLYDMGRREEALALYQKAYALDPELHSAKKMMEALQG